MHLVELRRRNAWLHGENMFGGDTLALVQHLPPPVLARGLHAYNAEALDRIIRIAIRCLSRNDDVRFPVHVRSHVMRNLRGAKSVVDVILKRSPSSRFATIQNASGSLKEVVDILEGSND